MRANPGTVAAAALTAITALALVACQSKSHAAEMPRISKTAVAASTGAFAWFAPRSAPAGWRVIGLPDHSASLSYPPTAAQVHADTGAVAIATTNATGQYLLYLNATPRQGAESLTDWTQFRISHLAAEDASTVSLDAAATSLPFVGGTGSCVLDHYTTRIGAHRYREISCYVLGAHGASVLVAATSEADWTTQRLTLERAVDSYAAH